MSRDIKFNVKRRELEKEDLKPRDRTGKFELVIEASAFSPRLSRRMESYADIIGDLNVCLLALAALAKCDLDKAGTEAGAFASQFIISYGRVFVRGEGRGVQPQSNEYWIPGGAKGLKIHDELMEYRMKLIAHAGVSPLRGQSCYVIVDSETNPTEAYGIYSANSTFNSILPEHVPEYENHVLELRKQIKKRRDETAEKLLQIAKEKLRKV